MTPSLRPGCAPARLLLELWERKWTGQDRDPISKSYASRRLVSLGFATHSTPLNGWLTLTPAGREAAQVLDAGSR